MMGRYLPTQYVRCNYCRRVLAGYVPKNGDGTLWLPRPHKFEGKKCEGRLMEAELVDDPVKIKATR